MRKFFTNFRRSDKNNTIHIEVSFGMTVQRRLKKEVADAAADAVTVLRVSSLAVGTGVAAASAPSPTFPSIRQSF